MPTIICDYCKQPVDVAPEYYAEHHDGPLFCEPCRETEVTFTGGAGFMATVNQLGELVKEHDALTGYDDVGSPGRGDESPAYWIGLAVECARGVYMDRVKDAKMRRAAG